jgi:hypothetical protein
MNSIPNELITEILEYLPLHDLRNKTQLISKLFKMVTRRVVGKKLAKLASCLNEFGGSITDEDKLKSIFESDVDARRKSASTEPFTAWILGNFDHSTESQVVTGIQMVLSSYNVSSGTLTFVPTGKQNFGMFICDLGYIPITTPYHMNNFSFSRHKSPGFRFWFHVSPGSSILRNSNLKQPKPQERIKANTGSYCMPLKDNLGEVGVLRYQIHGTKAQNSASMSTDQVIGSGLLDFLDVEEQKVSGSLISFDVNPQVLFAHPL